ncbi:MAG: hypothetical protein NVSMB25_08040 [Thermoleophilaceae bacterium]
MPPGLERTHRLAALTAACAVVPLLVSGCGRGAAADLVNGKTLFAGKGTCGTCHTLSHANTHGSIGPSLDEAFRAARHDGLGDSVIRGVVQNQIAYPRKGSAMPAHLVTGNNARDVAAYVASVAAQPGQDTGTLAAVGGAAGANKTAVASGGTLIIPADPSGALAYAFGKAQASAGAVSIQMPNKSPVAHNIALRGGATGQGPVVSSGGTSSFSVTLKPGTYTYYCQVPGHDQGGMHGTLTVK